MKFGEFKEKINALELSDDVEVVVLSGDYENRIYDSNIEPFMSDERLVIG